MLVGGQTQSEKTQLVLDCGRPPHGSVRRRRIQDVAMASASPWLAQKRRASVPPVGLERVARHALPVVGILRRSNALEYRNKSKKPTKRLRPEIPSIFLGIVSFGFLVMPHLKAFGNEHRQSTVINVCVFGKRRHTLLSVELTVYEHH